MSRAYPILSKIQKGHKGLEDAVKEEGDLTPRTSSEKAQYRIDCVFDRVGHGEISITAADLLANSRVASLLRMPNYPGLLCIWDYARAIRAAFIESVGLAVKLAEDEVHINC